MSAWCAYAALFQIPDRIIGCNRLLLSILFIPLPVFNKFLSFERIDFVR